MKLGRLSLLVSLVLLFGGTSCVTTQIAGSSSGPFTMADLTTVRTAAVITTGLDEQRQPIDRSATFLRQGRVYLHTTWQGLPDHPISARTELRDPSGAVVETTEGSFEPQGGQWISYGWHTFKPTDPAGVWEFQVYLDGVLSLRKEFLLREGHGIVAFAR